MNAATQRRIALVALAVFAVGMLFLITHRRVPPAMTPIGAPLISELVAKHEDQTRPVKDGDSMRVGEALDFQIEVKEQTFGYVFSTQGGHTRLEWGAGALEPAWERGVYAPNWNAPKLGLELVAPGPMTLYVLTAPLPIADVAQWDESAVKDPRVRCPRCGVAAVHFTIQEH
jgi:hypothetical protein